MANICSYRVIVKGKKNACYAFFGSMSCLDEKVIVNESGDEQDYTLQFDGKCKWNVDWHCTPWEGNYPVELPDDFEEARDDAEDKYWYNTVQDRSKMFDVEVWCNSADIDMPVGDAFVHYGNGEDLGGECPEEIAGITDNTLEEGYQCCPACGGQFPEEEMVKEGDLWFCQECHSEIFGDLEAD